MQDNNLIENAHIKQPEILHHFMQVVKRNDLSHSYLFNGEPGSGKLALALTITMRLFCTNVQHGLPCGKCNECMRISRLEHPDVVLIKPDGQSIKIAQIRFLKSEFTKSAVEGNQKVFIIDQVEKMSTSASNSLLKFIEEPTGNIVSFLLTEHKNRILSTIISRTQVINFPSLSNQLFNQELQKSGIPSDNFNLLATMTNNVDTAGKWLEDGWFNKLKVAVERWFQLIVKNDYGSFVVINTDIMPLIKEPSQKSMSINMMIQVWRDVLRLKYLNLTPKDLNFPQMFDILNKVANDISEKKLMEIIEMILQNSRLLSINIQFKNILEATTLRIMAKLSH